MISDFKVSRINNKKTTNFIATKELLSTGSGRTTICEVILKAAKKTYIEIEPYTVDEMESLIFEFCASIVNENSLNPESKPIISQEIEKAIRNIVDLKIIFKSVTEDNKTRSIPIDKAKELFKEFGEDVLRKTALNNANLESRTTIKIEFDNQKRNKNG